MTGSIKATLSPRFISWRTSWGTEPERRPQPDLRVGPWSLACERRPMHLELPRCGAHFPFVMCDSGADRVARARQKAVGVLDAAAQASIQIRHPSPRRRRCRNGGKLQWRLRRPNAEFRIEETSAHRKCSRTNPPSLRSRHDCGAYAAAGGERPGWWLWARAAHARSFQGQQTTPATGSRTHPKAESRWNELSYQRLSYQRLSLM
jgi:hypothetical protein